MSQVFTAEGKCLPVTVVRMEAAFTDELLNKAVQIVGKSKGKGFTGAMKRWGFAGLQATRGQSNTPRSAGSIGAQTPGRVLKGKKMAGHKGNVRITIKGSKIVQLNTDTKELMVFGPVPGARNSNVVLKVGA